VNDFPLAGMRCIEISERGGAAFAGKVLGRLGADVLKLELAESAGDRKEGVGFASSPAAVYFNAGKETRTLGAEGIEDVVRGADALVIDLELSRYPAWGLDPDTLDALACKIVCAVTPFGLSGPYANFAGPEIVTSAFGGMSYGIGEPGRPPLKMPLMQTAIQAGLIASLTIMAVAGMGSDENSTDSGRAAVVDISETDVWATIHAGTSMIGFLFANRVRKRAGRRVTGLPYPHQLFRCADGWIAIEPGRRRKYERFIEMVGSPEWALDGRYGTRLQINDKHADEVDALLAPWFMARTRSQIFDECRRRDIPAAPVRSIAEVVEDPELRARDCFEVVEGPDGGMVTLPTLPWKFHESGLRPTASVQDERSASLGKAES
jgi:CoA:oxalate CoA-transferase